MNKFTYGFELEGSFLSGVDRIIPGIYKSDGSVNIGSPINTPTLEYKREFESPVYQDFEDMIKALDGFKSQYINSQNSYAPSKNPREEGANHFWNYTCGLHLNIALAEDTSAIKLFNLITNFKFIESMQKEAIEFCSHQKYRLQKNNMYCKPYKDTEELRRMARVNNKYQFVRFHPEKRLEFRFLAACEHKVDNVTKTVQLIDDYLNSKYEVAVQVTPKPTTPSITKKVRTQIERIL